MPDLLPYSIVFNAELLKFTGCPEEPYVECQLAGRYCDIVDVYANICEHLPAATGVCHETDRDQIVKELCCFAVVEDRDEQRDYSGE